MDFFAPVNPGVREAIFLASWALSRSVFNGSKCTLKIDALPLMSGAGTNICLSNLPGRRRALSRMSTLLVAANTTTFVVVLKPFFLRKTSFNFLSYDSCNVPRLVQTESLINSILFTIHFYEQLIQRILLLGMSSEVSRTSLSSYRVYFVNE